MRDKYYLKLLILLFPLILKAQEEGEYNIPEEVPFTKDSLYREDQFYAGFSFNLITNKPTSLSQESFSGGLHLGFTRDFPLNEKRTLAFGLGAGWSINTYGHNLFIDQDASGNTSFRSLDRQDEYDTNRFTTQLIEAPVELRWRTSTVDSYKFWRIYTGFRLGYIYHFRSYYKDAENQIVINDLPELNRFRLGTTFTFGYNTFNFQFYYALNPFFKNASVDDKELGLSTLKIGLTFYIL